MSRGGGSVTDKARLDRHGESLAEIRGELRAVMAILTALSAQILALQTR